MQRAPIHIPGPRDYWAEVLNNDHTHGLIVARFDTFAAALAGRIGAPFRRPVASARR
jgi:hypothetical protein